MRERPPGFNWALLAFLLVLAVIACVSFIGYGRTSMPWWQGGY
jgi:hypothetical protein